MTNREHMIMWLQDIIAEKESDVQEAMSTLRSLPTGHLETERLQMIVHKLLDEIHYFNVALNRHISRYNHDMQIP